jgi:predicted transcriptional regulator
MRAETYRRLQEQVLQNLYERFPVACSAQEVAADLVRDHELVRRLLRELHAKRLVSEVREGKGGAFTAWRRWKLAPDVHARYAQLARPA